ncbi:MAG: hypothetical protein NT070_03160, partial [Cyanobacteria bacterium]|nr:hypothetical protein [Cyanobacteriota bacterium]
RELSLPLMPLAPKKTAQIIVDSENNYLGALKGNQSGLLEAVKAQFKTEQSDFTMNKGHGRIEKRIVSISQSLAVLSILL